MLCHDVICYAGKLQMPDREDWRNRVRPASLSYEIVSSTFLTHSPYHVSSQTPVGPSRVRLTSALSSTFSPPDVRPIRSVSPFARLIARI
eukprot:9483925-Pyramimonas_sp.AAC.1